MISPYAVCPIGGFPGPIVEVRMLIMQSGHWEIAQTLANDSRLFAYSPATPNATEICSRQLDEKSLGRHMR